MKYLDPIEEKKKEMLKLYRELKNNPSALAKLVSLFNITGLKGHENIDILSIDLSIPRIVLINQDTKVIFTIELTKESNLVNCLSADYQFIKITEQHYNKIIEYLYDLKQSPIAQKISYPNGEYELSLMKEYQTVDCIRSFKRAYVTYSKAINYKGNNLMQPLLTKVTKDNYLDNTFDYRVQNTYTYGDPCLICKLNPEDNYSYQIRDSIIYGTNESEEEGLVHYFCGVCFENFKEVNSKYLPYNIEMKDFTCADDKDIKSGIIFKGGTLDCLHHILEIYIKDDSLNIRYHVSQNGKDEDCSCSHKEVINYDINLPIQNNGKISSALLQHLASVLVKQFEQDIFIKRVAEKINEFALKIAIKNNENIEIMNSLDSQIIIDMPIEDIIDLVENSEVNYFEAMEKELERMIKMPIGNIKEKKFN